MKKYLLAQLFQVSAWIGLALIISAFVAPRWVILTLGVLLILTDDEKLKGWVAKHAPGINAWLEEKIR
jgi:hypothetical protein